jgi:CBS domain-containing membrane protein
MLTTHKPFTALTAADVMSPGMLTIPRHMSLRTAARLLSQARVSGAPVVDEAGVLIGVLSTTDFVRWVEKGSVAHPEEPTCVCSDWQSIDAEKLPTDEVACCMTADPVTASLWTPITELARMMLDAHIHRVIVLDERGHPTGIVTSTDLLAAVARGAEWHEH